MAPSVDPARPRAWHGGDSPTRRADDRLATSAERRAQLFLLIDEREVRDAVDAKVSHNVRVLRPLHTTKLTWPSYRFSKRIIAGAASRQEMHHGA